MTYFCRVDDTTRARITEIIDEHHPSLVEAGVTIDALFHYPRLDDHGEVVPGSGLKHNGYAAAGICKIVGTKDRAKGCADVEITFDKATWDELEAEEQEALIDHELFHAQVERNQRGEVLQDDVGRPKLKARKHDFEIGGFMEIVRRHGQAALEAQYVRRVATSEDGQLFLPGILGPALDGEEPVTNVSRLRTMASKATDASPSA